MPWIFMTAVFPLAGVMENFSAWNNLAMGTRENGFASLDTRFTFNIVMVFQNYTLYPHMSVVSRLENHTGLSPENRVDLGFLWENCHFF